MVRQALPLLVAAMISAGEWPQFRGPNGSGVSDAARLPVEIGPSKNVKWKTELPSGHSSPVITGGRIILTAAEGGSHKQLAPGRIIDEGGKLLTICLDQKTGEILWKREVPRPRIEKYQPTNSAASPSPVTDGKNVYVFFGDYGLAAYNLKGDELWKHPLGPFNNPNGHGSSPVLVDDLLVLLCDQDSGSYLLAVETKSGKVRWKVDRPDVTRSYSTPAVLRPKTGSTELVVPGAYQLASYAADTGKKLWWITGLSWQPKSTPVVVGDMVYAHWWENGGEAEQPTETPSFADVLSQFDSNQDKRITQAEFAPDARLQRGFGDNDLNADGSVDEREWEFYRARRASRNALLAVRHGKQGDLTGSGSIVWRMQKFLPNVPSPLLYQNVMYLIKDGGILTAVDSKTGDILKQGRLPDALDTYYASPVAGAGKVYLMSHQGKLTVVKAGPQWEILATSDFGEESFATPAIADETIYIRTKTGLYAFAASEAK